MSTTTTPPTRIGLTGSPEIAAWCAERDHPIITYNPWIDLSLCRCGRIQVDGDAPQTEAGRRATHDLFHTCSYEDGYAHCSCYLPSFAHG